MLRIAGRRQRLTLPVIFQLIGELADYERLRQ